MRLMIFMLAVLAATGCASRLAGSSVMSTKPTKRTINIELLALDLETCGRCTGTSANLAEAVEIVAARLREQGTDVRVTRHVVKTAAEAERLRFVSSPTIRIDGRDIALEFRESNCGDCGDICGCEGGVDCRVWVWQGREHLEAPTDMIVQSLLTAHAAGPAPADAAPYVMPDNLRRFFASTASASAAPAAVADDCCDHTTCCEADDKQACCGSAGKAGANEPCGCR